MVLLSTNSLRLNESSSTLSEVQVATASGSLSVLRTQAVVKAWPAWAHATAVAAAPGPASGVSGERVTQAVSEMLAGIINTVLARA